MSSAREKAKVAPIFGPKDNRPEIRITVDEKRVIDESIAAVAAGCDRIYQRGRALVHVIQDDRPFRKFLRGGSPHHIVELPQAGLRESMAASARYVKLKERTDEWIPAHPPDWAVKAFAARGQWKGIRHLEKIIESPVLRPDGSVLDTPGYDAATGLLYMPAIDFGRIPESPSRADAESARDELAEIVCDIPFGRPEHRAAYFAGLLTALAQYTFDGPAPLFVIDANVRGVGKSLTADTVGEVNSGRLMARMAYPKSDEEMEKRITALALAGESQVLIDNVEGQLGSAALNAAVTGTTWRGRILGKSEMSRELPLRIVWWATGNNLILDGDTVRRVLHVRLESHEERPEERQNFKHPNLLEWVHQERARFVRAALTLLRGYFIAGRPDMNIKPWGSFEAWSAVVRNALVWIGEPDPALTRGELAEQADSEAGALRALIEGIDTLDPRGAGVTTSRMIQASANGNELEGLREAIAEMCPARDGKTPSPKSLGKRLQHLRQRVVGGRYIDRARDTSGGALWVVRKAGPAA